MTDHDKMLKKSYRTPTARTFRTHALQCWPKPQNTQDCGLACLVVVVRHLLSCLPRQLRCDIAASYPSTLKGFLRDDPRRALDTLRSVFDPKQPMTFESLIEQAPMTSMLQTHRSLRLGYASSSEGQTPSLAPVDSYIEWDGTGKLSDHVERKMQTWLWNMTDPRSVLRYADAEPPIVIRLKYTSKDPKMQFHSHLASFSLRAFSR